MTHHISSPITQQTKHDPIVKIHISVCQYSSRCRLIPHISPGVFERPVLTVGPWVLDLAGAWWGVLVGWRQAGMSRDGMVGWSLRMTRRASTWKTACVLFPTDGSAPRLEGEDRVGEGETVCGFSLFSSCVSDFYLPLTVAWGPKRGKPCFYLSQDGGLIQYLPAL